MINSQDIEYCMFFFIKLFNSKLAAKEYIAFLSEQETCIICKNQTRVKKRFLKLLNKKPNCNSMLNMSGDLVL